MGKVNLSEFVTLDHHARSRGSEGFVHGGWQIPFFDEDINASPARDVVFESDALLLGRMTFERFARARLSITDDEEFADRMKSMPKFVATRTLTEPTGWNATIIQGNVVGEVNRLKRDRILLVSGSGELARALLQVRPSASPIQRTNRPERTRVLRSNRRRPPSRPPAPREGLPGAHRALLPGRRPTIVGGTHEGRPSRA